MRRLELEGATEGDLGATEITEAGQRFAQRVPGGDVRRIGLERLPQRRRPFRRESLPDLDHPEVEEGAGVLVVALEDAAEVGLRLEVELLQPEEGAPMDQEVGG